MSEQSSLAARVIQIVRSVRVDLSTEKQAQADVERVLNQAGFVFAREFPLTKRDVIDFMIDGVGLELKLKGSQKKDVYRQLCRYARHTHVDSLILASNLSMGLPTQIEGKDAYFVRLGEAWL